jgi:hypothetical protein
LFVGTVVTKDSNLKTNSPTNKEFKAWWIEEGRIFDKMLFPEEGYRIVKSFDKPFEVGNTSFIVSMAMLSNEKDNENPPESEKEDTDCSVTRTKVVKTKLLTSLEKPNNEI